MITTMIQPIQTPGRLYNWHAVNDSRNIAPIGWHVPTLGDWNTLFEFLGGQGVSGGKLKETGSAHWISPNSDATNEFGFTALPGGSRFITFGQIGLFGYLWSSTSDPSQSANAWVNIFLNTSNSVNQVAFSKINGYSVRCVKDF